jgi:beta-phosphoglucomutase family hydrolase
MMAIRAVLFDLDGLLTNTEGLHSEAWRRTFTEYGVHITEREYAELWIRRGVGVFEFLRERDLGDKLDPQELMRRKDEIFRELAERQLQPMPGALQRLNELRGRVKLALVSSARRNAVKLVLEKLDIRGFFDVVITHEDVPRSKPHPEPFLIAAEKLSVRPEECVVIEDAEKGVVAARRAGMKVIAVPNGLTHNNDFSQADLVVNSLQELSWERIRALGDEGPSTDG